MAETDYDRYRDRYEDDLNRALAFSGKRHEFFTRAKADELLRVARNHVGDPGHIDALDVGCGIGLTDRYLDGRFRSLTGVDVAPGVLKRAAATNPGVRYELYDGHTLPFDDASVDLAFAVCVVQVLPAVNRPRFVSELGRVTRRSGLVVVMEHNPVNPLTRLVVRRCSFEHDARMLRLGELEELYQGAGLAVIDRGFILVFPTRRGRLLGLERRLARIPVGAQYYLAGRSAPSDHSSAVPASIHP
jgi:SAM-dependent methyltransferase